MDRRPKKALVSAFGRQQGRCCYCTVPTWLTNPSVFAARHGLGAVQAWALMATTEHLIARRDGGTNRISNIACACLICNQLRHAVPAPLPPLAYRDYVQAEVARGTWPTAGIVERAGPDQAPEPFPLVLAAPATVPPAPELSVRTRRRVARLLLTGTQPTYFTSEGERKLIATRINYEIGQRTTAVLCSNSHHDTEDPEAIFRGVVRHHGVCRTTLVRELLAMTYRSDSGQHRAGDPIYSIDPDPVNPDKVLRVLYDGSEPRIVTIPPPYAETVEETFELRYACTPAQLAEAVLTRLKFPPTPYGMSAYAGNRSLSCAVRVRIRVEQLSKYA